MDFFAPHSDGTIFDSSLSEFLDIKLSPEQYKSSVVEIFALINRAHFPGNRHKQKIYTFVDRVSGACPYCGDSAKDPFKKRGNIILKGEHAGYYKCFNCGMYKPMVDFFKDFKVDPNLDIINYVSSIYSDHHSGYHSKYDLSVLFDTEKIEQLAVSRDNLKSKFGFTEVKESPQILFWLNKRLQYDEHRFLYHRGDNYLVILNTTKTGMVIGYQRRNFTKGLDKYKTFNLNKLHEMMETGKEIPDEINAVSQVYRIFEADFSKPVVLFEGPLDSFLFPNGIANTGANKKFPLDIPVWYFYDDDVTGRQRAMERMNNREMVFLWTKFKQDVGLPYRSKWDLNDVKIWARDNDTRLPYFEGYFSKDTLDMIDI